MVACAAVQETRYLRRLLGDLGRQPVGATVIYEDNQGCVALAQNPVSHKRRKHIDIKYQFVREKVASAEVQLEYIATEHQAADILTKPLPKPKLETLRTKILGQRI